MHHDKQDGQAEMPRNGKRLGTVWCAPWRIDLSGNLKEEGNLLEIKVANLWTNRLIGDASRPQQERFTRMAIRPPLDGGLRPSGLLGPVTLETPGSVRIINERME